MKKILTYKQYNVIQGTDSELLAHAANKFIETVSNQPGVAKHISMFGGSTVFKLFAYLEENNLIDSINWNDVHIWWGDERIVPFESEESNYGELNRKYLSKINIPQTNIHPIGGFDGEDVNKLEDEVKRITTLTYDLVPSNDQNLPSFDLVFLGIGDDGHTASCFPGFFDVEDTNLYFSTVHPISFQPRISASIKLLNAAKNICFLAFGDNKARAITEIIDVIFLKISFAEVIERRGGNPDQAFEKDFLPKDDVDSPVCYIGLQTNCDLCVDDKAASLIDLRKFLEKSRQAKNAAQKPQPKTIDAPKV